MAELIQGHEDGQMKTKLILAVLLALSASAHSQQQKVEFSTFQLSDTVYMLIGSGGNVGISTGDDGLFIIDDQVSQISPQLLKRSARLVTNRFAS